MHVRVCDRQDKMTTPEISFDSSTGDIHFSKSCNFIIVETLYSDEILMFSLEIEKRAGTTCETPASYHRWCKCMNIVYVKSGDKVWCAIDELEITFTTIVENKMIRPKHVIIFENTTQSTKINEIIAKIHECTTCINALGDLCYVRGHAGSYKFFGNYAIVSPLCIPSIAAPPMVAQPVTPATNRVPP